jgi:hypothetical protein
VWTWKVITLFHININIYSFFDPILRSIVIPFLSLLDSFFDFIYSILFYFILCCSSCFYFVFLLFYFISFHFILFYCLTSYPLFHSLFSFSTILFSPSFHSLISFSLPSHLILYSRSSILFQSFLFPQSTCVPLSPLTAL